MIRAISAREACLRLEQSYASSSEARIMQLLYHLLNTKKGSKSVTEYKVLMKSLADDLVVNDYFISDRDLVLYIMSGLGLEYGPFVASITTRNDRVSYADLHGYLQSQELRLATEVSTFQVDSQAFAMTKVTNDNKKFSNSFNNNRNNKGGREGGREHRAPYHQQHLFIGGQSNHYNQVICQYCNRVGHTSWSYCCTMLPASRCSSSTYITSYGCRTSSHFRNFISS